MKKSFRKVQPIDLPQINKLMNQIHRLHYDQFPLYFKNKHNIIDVTTFESYIAEDKMYVLTIDDYIVAFALFEMYEVMDNPAINDRKIMYLIDICVDVMHRKEKIGTEIFMHVEQLAIKNSCTEIDLDVYNFNKSAIQFYESLKFDPIKIGMKKYLTTAST